MKIGLIDADGHNFPNLALMKLSASYKKSKSNTVEFVNYWDWYDEVYISKVFTFSRNPLNDYEIKTDYLSLGGTGWDDQATSLEKTLDSDTEHEYPDYTLYPGYNYALGFLTRGCPRNCPFCIVSCKEGVSTKHVADLNSFWKDQKEIKLLDPNILAYINRETLLKQLIRSRAYVDFTQGLDIRFLCDKDTIDLIKEIKIKRIHFAYDSKYSGIIEACLLNFKRHTGWARHKVSVYVLSNYDSSIEDDLYRINFIKSLDYSPYLMLYDFPNASQQHKDLQRWCNSPQLLWSIDYHEYQPRGKYDRRKN